MGTDSDDPDEFRRRRIQTGSVRITTNRMTKNNSLEVPGASPGKYLTHGEL